LKARWARLYLKDMTVVKAMVALLIATVGIMRIGYMTGCSNFKFERMVCYLTMSRMVE
jgi:hypothetical protein